MYVLQAFAQYVTFQYLFYFAMLRIVCLCLDRFSLKTRKEFLDLLPTVFDFLRLKLVLVADRHPSLPSVCVFCWVSLL